MACGWTPGFCLSYRDVEELLFARGVMVTYAAIRQWCQKFGQAWVGDHEYAIDLLSGRSMASAGLPPV
jgi:hypothetical protein